MEINFKWVIKLYLCPIAISQQKPYCYLSKQLGYYIVAGLFFPC